MVRDGSGAQCQRESQSENWKDRERRVRERVRELETDEGQKPEWNGGAEAGRKHHTSSACQYCRQSKKGTSATKHMI